MLDDFLCRGQDIRMTKMQLVLWILRTQKTFKTIVRSTILSLPQNVNFSVFEHFQQPETSSQPLLDLSEIDDEMQAEN